MTAKVSVVILTWNDAEMMRAAVQSALASSDADVEVVVVDNGSQPPAEAPPGVRLVRASENLGVARGRNLGVANARHDLICFLDSDAMLRPSSLARLVEGLESDPTIALAAPVFEGQPAEASAGRMPSVGLKLRRIVGRTAVYDGVDRFGRDIWDVDFAIGACQLFRRSAYDSVGGLERRWFYGPEDTDFCLRLRVAGWRVVQTERAGCVHVPRRNRRAPLSARGLAHAWTLVQFYWRHRHYRRAMRLRAAQDG